MSEVYPFTRSPGFWSRENIENWTERQRQIAANEQAEQQRAQFAEFMANAGQVLIDIVNSYLARNEPAETEKVAVDFHERCPHVDFRQSVELLKQHGVLYEVPGPAGFMGMRTTRLYVVG